MDRREVIVPQAPFESAVSERILEAGRQVVTSESRALAKLAANLGPAFVKVVGEILACSGRVVVSGIGKSGLIAQKVSSTFASVGVPSLFLHPGDAIHGDLGRVAPGDVVMLLSYSGETEELLRLVGPLKNLQARVIAVTASSSSSLGEASHLVVPVGTHDEAGHGLAPTTSTSVILALGDAIAMALVEIRGVSDDAFHRFHPGGSIGRKLAPVGAVMRSGDMVPIVSEGAALALVIAVMTQTRGRPGAACVVDDRQRLVGIFTDGDLRRQIERGTFSLDVTVGEVMCRAPKTVRPTELVVDAARLLSDFRIDQVPVVDDEDRPIGLLDVQDLLAQRFV